MTAITAIGINRTGSSFTKTPYAPGQRGFSAVNLLAAGVHGLLPPTERSAADASPQSFSRGLGLIDGKLAAGLGGVRPAPRRADSLAALWIGVPFATVFLLGCLTLA